ncbi:hypothetical protein POTOM_037252 [Populus tomentosa]|uniref:Retrovirus-related Pol polyprotein from transposon TNT 1-94-like beta-barrel domain-containing protein n=1 Tax=Populus tomentosa TaxID=118781 RepID=A0A8X7YP67_POPTO|nr:hypothetical protein POTOM_037252 [Populus tomentosa]
MTPTSSSSSVVSSNLPISLAALTNNFSTHLNADNYLLWRDQITPLLICNDLYGHIDGTDSPPSKTILIDGTTSPNPEYARCILGQYPTHPSPPPADFSNKSFSNSLHHGKPRFSTGYNAGNRSQFGRSRYRGHCQIYKQEGHSASNCTYRYIRPDSHNTDNLSTPFAGIHVFDSPSPAENSPDCVWPLWLGDRGATNHMASYADLVQQPFPFNGPSGVYVGNGDSLRISHIGNSSINLGNNSLSLKDILVVPQLKENLISIAKLIKDNNCVFACFSWGYVIKDLATGVILLKGPVKDNLYPIPAHALSTSLRTFSCNNATFVAHTANAASCSTWHRRLGHPGSKIL